MAKLVILTLHGIGTYFEDFQDSTRRYDKALHDGLRARLGRDFDDIVWRPVLWSAASLEKRQQALIDARKPPRLWDKLFRFVSTHLCDATAYMLPHKAEDLAHSSYCAVQREVRKALRKLEAEVPGAGALPVLVIAESMGCRVLSCYAWDAAQAPERVLEPGETAADLTPFQRLETLAGLIFTGCNLPLLTMEIPNAAMLPMKLPLHPLAAVPSFTSTWLNLYDDDDVLGYPIGQEFAAYFGTGHLHAHRFDGWNRKPAAEQRPRDIVVKIRHLLGWTPFAHVQYWKSSSVLDLAAGEVRRLLAALRQA